MEYDELKLHLAKIIDNDYENFVKVLISLELDIDNKYLINRLYKKYMEDYNKKYLLNSCFEEYIKKIAIQEKNRNYYQDLDNDNVIDSQDIDPFDERFQDEGSKVKYYEEKYEQRRI